MRLNGPVTCVGAKQSFGVNSNKTTTFNRNKDHFCLLIYKNMQASPGNLTAI
jgi:hypothetical protein